LHYKHTIPLLTHHAVKERLVQEEVGLQHEAKEVIVTLVTPNRKNNDAKRCKEASPKQRGVIIK
jgi:hypothetical protein